MYINTHLQYQITEHFMSAEEKYKTGKTTTHTADMKTCCGTSLF